MRILAISDVPRWQGYEELVDTVRPDVLVMPGDLVADGYLDFVNIFQHIPSYMTAYKALVKEHKAIVTREGRHTSVRAKGPFIDEWMELRRTTMDGPDFEPALLKAHVGPFYRFLQHAGTRTKVLVTKGDHDDDIPENYQVDRINKTPGCQEISGNLVTIGDVAFLGFGFDEGEKPSLLKPIAEKFAGKADIVLCHPPQKMVPRVVDELRPKLLVRGHNGNGRYLVNGVPAAFTQNAHHTIIEYERGKMPSIQQFGFGKGDGVRPPLRRGNIMPAASQKSQWETYAWLKPFPGDNADPPQDPRQALAEAFEIAAERARLGKRDDESGP